MLNIEDWKEVDRALEEAGMCDLEMSELSCSLGRRLHDLIGEYSERLSALGEKRRQIESAVEAFCTLRRAEFGPKRSRQFHFGKIAFRLTERIEIADGLEEAAVSTLKKFGHGECVEIRERLDRNALKRLADDELARCGIRRAREDRFRIEPDLNLICEKLGRKEPLCAPFTVDLQKLDRAIGRREEAAA